MKLYLVRSAALGNGTREAGSLVGESSAASIDEVSIGNTTLAGDWTSEEMRNLLRNPELYSDSSPESIDLAMLAAVPSGGETNSENSSNREAEQMDAEFAAYLKSFAISDMPELTGNEKELLKQFPTALELYQFGEENQGLEKIAGVTKKIQKAIYASVGKIIRDFEAIKSAESGTKEPPKPDLPNDPGQGQEQTGDQQPPANEPVVK